MSRVTQDLLKQARESDREVAIGKTENSDREVAIGKNKKRRRNKRRKAGRHA